MAWPTLTDALVTAEVRTLLGEPTARRISDAEIVRWINRGLQTICKMNLARGSTSSFALVTNQYAYIDSSYSMTDCIAVRAVIYTASTSDTDPNAGAKALLKMHPRHFSNIRASTAGAPQEYFWHKRTLYVWPLPSATENTKKITVFYYALDEDLSTGDDFQSIPENYGPYLIWYAYSSALDKLGKHEQALQYMSYFNNFLLFHRQADDPWVSVDSADMMVLPDRTQIVNQ